MKKEITIKQVGGGWVVTVWTPPKTDKIGDRMQVEQVFTDHDKMIAFVTKSI